MTYLFLADGFEEIEAVTPADILRRAGEAVVLVGVGKSLIRGAHGIVVQTDAEIQSLSGDKPDLVVLPGGMPGTDNLEGSPLVKELVADAAERGALIGAICAAPKILGAMGLLRGKRAVCFPGFEDALEGAAVCDEQVVRDGGIITARAAGAAAAFGFALAEARLGTAVAKELRSRMYFPASL